MLLQCPKCRNRMQYQPKQGIISEKKKKCVYCGYNFKIHPSPEKSRIIDI